MAREVTRAAFRVVWSMRHTVRYGGIEPPPVSHERQAAFVSVYRIDAQSAKREERKMPAKPKGGNYHGGSFRRLRRSGAPLRAVPLVLILPYFTPFRECRGITK